MNESIHVQIVIKGWQSIPLLRHGVLICKKEKRLKDSTKKVIFLFLPTVLPKLFIPPNFSEKSCLIFPAVQC